MKRIEIQPRPNLKERLEKDGFYFHSDYYSETSAYVFKLTEVIRIEKATASLFQLCMEAIDWVIKKNRFDDFLIPKKYWDLIKASWKEDYCSFYGRMDLAVNHDSTEIFLLEFNADTPTSLLEASVVQWKWLEDFNPIFDQFNSIHEKLLSHFKYCRSYLLGNKKLWFTGIAESIEDYTTILYLQDIASQAGISTDFINIPLIGVDRHGDFYGMGSKKFIEPIHNIFKLYPYEWMFKEPFGDYLSERTLWIEPFYKAILSNKYLLVLLYNLFPNHPNLLPAFSNETHSLNQYVQKPIFGREGNNVRIMDNNHIIQEKNGDYGKEGFVFQQYQELPEFQGFRPVIGSWIIGGKPAGMGIKETSQYIHDDMSQFCPHFIQD